MKDFLKYWVIPVVVMMSIITLLSMSMTHPDKPKSTVVKSFRTINLPYDKPSSKIETDIENYINSMTAKGYVVKIVALSDDDNYSKGIVVMEYYY